MKGLKVVHTYMRGERTTVILETTPDAYQQIMEKSKLYIGWQKCPVYEDLNVGICYKCCGYNHNSKRCSKKEICAKCTGEHRTSDCIASEYKCINCLSSNKYHNTDGSVNHMANDPKLCSSLRYALERRKKLTNYPTATNSTC